MNAGSSSLIISGVNTTGDFAQTNTCVGLLASQASCTVNVTFTPTATGSRSGQLTVTNSGNPGALTLGVSGVGLPALTYTANLSPTALNFGSQALNTTAAAQTVTLSNTGTGMLTLGSIKTTGDYTQTNTCAATLAASGSCTVSVSFVPTAAGARAGTLLVTEKESTGAQSVALSGVGAMPLVSSATLTPPALSFTQQGVGSSSAAQSATLSNTGTAPLTISSITISGDFAQTNTCGASLASGTSCSINLVFQPTTTGMRSGALTGNDTATPSTQIVTLSGVGGAALTLGPASLGGDSATVVSGAIATYSLSLSSSSYTGNVALSCSGAPQNATCTISPGSVSASPGQSTPFTVTVNTSSVQASLEHRGDRGVRFAILGLSSILLAPLLPWSLRRCRGRAALWIGMLLITLVLLPVSGCGGGANLGSTAPNTRQVAPGTYALTVSGTGTGYAATESLTLIVR